MHRPLLMTGEYVVKTVLKAVERVVERHYLPSGIAEYCVDPFGDKRAAHRLGTLNLFTHI